MLGSVIWVSTNAHSLALGMKVHKRYRRRREGRIIWEHRRGHFANQVLPYDEWRPDLTLAHKRIFSSSSRQTSSCKSPVNFPTVIIALCISSTVQAHLIPLKGARHVSSKGSGNGGIFSRSRCPGVFAWFCDFRMFIVAWMVASHALDA